VPPVPNRPERPRRRPDKLHADKADNHRRCHHACLRRGIRHRIAHHGIESSQRLGMHRWVIQCTFAWINRFRRFAIRYERRLDVLHAFTALACSLIYLSARQDRVERRCQHLAGIASNLNPNSRQSRLGKAALTRSRSFHAFRTFQKIGNDAGTMSSSSVRWAVG
jgi:transposase